MSCAGLSTDARCLQSELSELLGSPNQDCVSQAERWVKELEMTFSENYSWSDLAAQFCLWYTKKIQLSRTRLSWAWLRCPTRHSFQVIPSKFDARGWVKLPRWSLVHLNCSLNHILQREYFGVLLLVLFALFSFKDWIRKRTFYSVSVMWHKLPLVWFNSSSLKLSRTAQGETGGSQLIAIFFFAISHLERTIKHFSRWLRYQGALEIPASPVIAQFL